jgi:WD40 repeat protein/uncharacterized caspase-like protein
MALFLSTGLPIKNNWKATDSCLHIHFLRAAKTPVNSCWRSWSAVFRAAIAPATVGIFLLFVSQAFAQSKEQTELVPQLGHSSGVLNVAFSPDGKLIASASRDGNVKLWDGRNQRLLRTFLGKKAAAGKEYASVAFSPDGKTILTAVDQVMRLWDADKNGEPIWTASSEAAGNVTSAAFSRDGRWFASADKDGSLRLWDAGTLRLLRTFKGHTKAAITVAFAPNGKVLASGSEDGTVKLWDPSTGRELAGHLGDFGNMGGMNMGGINSVAFSPDSREFVAGSDDKTVTLLDVQTGRRLRSFVGHGGAVDSVGFSPDGKFIVSGSWDGTIKLWDKQSARELRTFRATEQQINLLSDDVRRINSVVFSPDGHQILSGSEATTLSLWDVDSGHQLFGSAGPAAQQVFSVAFAPNGLQFASGTDDGATSFWETNSGHKAYSNPGGSNPASLFSSFLAYSPDGRTIASSGSVGAIGSYSSLDIKLLDADTGRERRSFTNESGVTSVAFSPDGSKIVSGADQTVKLWDFATGKLIRSLGGEHATNVRSVSFSPDGKTVASEDEDANIKIWNLADGNEITSFREGTQGGALVYLADGRHLASANYENGITLWDVQSGRKTQSLDGLPFSLVISNNNCIISGNLDGTITIWDTTSGTAVHTLEGHTGVVTSVAVSPDAKKLLSGSMDATIKVWDVESGALLGTAISFTDGEWIFMTPEGFFDASENGAKNLNVVRGLEVSSIDQLYDALHRPDLVQQKLAGDPQGLVRAAATKLDLDKVASSGVAPEVRIETLSSSVSEPQALIEATLTDRGGGIGRVEWRNNKKVLEIDAMSGTASGAKGKTAVVRKTVPLVVGDNVIELKAFNAQNLIESESVQVTITRTEQPQTKSPRPQLYVLAVGVNDYWDSKLRLNFAVPDARSMAEGLQRAGGSLYERVNVTTVLDADVSAAKLDHIFADLKGKVQPQDVFVFFLSGHGKTEGGKFYYIPQDFRYNGAESIVQNAISHEKLKGWFAQIPAQKSVLLFDACESGALIQGQIAMRGLEEKTAIDHLVRATGATVLTATTDDTPAAEGYHGHGVFTYALLSAFANADANGDGFIDVQELANYVITEVPALTEAAWQMRQVPQMNVVGSIYPLVAKTSLLSAAEEPTVTLPSAPTHVVIAVSTVRQFASAASAAVIELKPGMQVRVMETSGGWILVAREGKKLGYIEARTVAGLQ